MSYSIEMIRGTTSIQQIVLMEDGHPYILSSDEFIHFGIKEAGYQSRILVDKIFTHKDQNKTTGEIEFKILPEETKKWPVKTYKYDIGLQSGEDYFIVIPESDFVVKQNITGYVEGL